MEDKEEFEEDEELYEEDEDDEDIGSANIIDESDSGTPRPNFQEGEQTNPYLDSEPIEKLDDLQDTPSQTTVVEPEGETHGYAGPSQLYNAPYESDYAAAAYAEAGSQPQMKTNLDSQIDTTGGALRIDEQAIRDNSLNSQGSQDVNMRGFQRGMGMESQEKHYVGTPGRESDVLSGGLPFQGKERRRF